jgi:Leucine-rich repeat (LRR) protein
MNYSISVTGDCQNTGSGAISLSINGGSPPYIVQWASPNLGTDYNVYFDPLIRTSLNSNFYGVTVVDSTSPNQQILNISIPVSSGVCASILGVQGTTCSLDNGSVTGTSSSNYSTTDFYLYDSNDNFITTQTTNINVSDVIFGGLSAGTYYMKVVDLGGCTGYSQNFIIEDSSPLNFGLYTVPNSSCGGTPIGKIFVTGVTGTPPYSYTWNNGATGNTITGLTSGPYSVTVTDSYGCSTTKGTTVTDVPQIGLGTFTAIQPTCFQADGSFTIQITGGTAPYYYSASTGEVSIQYGTSWTVSGLSAGNYFVQVTDAALCTFVAGTFLTPPQGMSSVSVITSGSTCSSTDGSIQVSVNGGVTPYTYTLIYPNGNTTNISGTNTVQIFPNLSSGTYSVVVQDSSSCSYMEEVTLFATDTFTLSANTTGTTCNISNGIITVEKSVGGVSPFNYSLDGVQNFPNSALSAVTFSNVSSGEHTISVSDAAGCVQTKQIYVGESEALDFSLYSTSCGNGSAGSISSLISSGTPPFTFYWSNNIPTNPQQIQVSGLTADTYTLRIVDALGCSLERFTTINCDKLYVSYETYLMGGGNFTIKGQTKFGLVQMLNQGFNDLTFGKTGCSLLQSVFNLKISVNPSGYTMNENFFTGYTLNSAPSDSLYTNTLKEMLLNVPGVGGVTINPETNQLAINTIPGDNTLTGQKIKVELVIFYDILCDCTIGPDYNFDVTANWNLVGIPPVTNETTFVGWLNSLGATSVNVTAFSLVADRLEATISVDGVKSLDLNDKGVTLVNKVGGFTGLNILDLGNNNITIFDPITPLPTSISVLYLNDNNIVTFNPTIALPVSLVQLYLGGNQIVTFNPTIALPFGLAQLYLGGNQIVTFNPTTALPVTLDQLYLEGNQIVTFNPTIALPTSLRLLSLNSNDIVTFNPTIALPTSLDQLYLADNQIVTFNPTIALPASLSVLDLSINQIVTFNPTIALPTSLTILALADNQIVTFNPTIALPASLTILTLDSNQIVTFNPTIALPTNLSVLSLARNQIVTFNPTIALPTSLSGLYLGFNQIATFNPTIALPTNLNELALGANQIVAFNPTIPLPNSLDILNLTNNLMTTAGYTTSQTWANAQTSFTSLCTVSFTGNVNPISGTNLETILISKNCLVIP